MHHTASNVAVNQPGFVGVAASVSTPLKQTPMTGTDTETPSNASTASNTVRPTILDKTKRQLIDAVTKNRLTIVIGPTG